MDEYTEQSMERYDIHIGCNGYILKEKDDDGDWVRYDDAATRISELEAQLAATQKQLTAAQEREATYTEYKRKLEAIVTWLEHHEQGVFARGLWDVLYK